MFALEKKPSATMVRKPCNSGSGPWNTPSHAQRSSIQRILRGHSIQPKLKIGSPNDAYEQEADRVALQVMGMRDTPRLGSESIDRHANAPSIQRLCEECEEDLLRRKSIVGMKVEEEEEQIQTKHTKSESPSITPNFEKQVRRLDSGGESLSPSEKDFFTRQFGYDFSHVKIHTDPQSAELAESLHSHAFTLGNHIVFNRNRYRPHSSEGRYLLAHELTHVVQQDGASSLLQRLTISRHSFTQGTCGERNVQWVFSLDAAAPEDGYIVQQIDSYEIESTCPDLAVGPPAPTQTFWEAWLVKKGDKVDWTTVRDKWTDGSTRGPRPGKNGHQISFGEVKFFKKSTTGDLGDFNKAPADKSSPWGPGKVPTSGGLPSTPTKPSWWDNSPVEGPTKRSATSIWNCCDADKSKHTSNVTANP